jgi:hypothetical protein
MRALARRLLPEPARLRIHHARLRAAHLPMRLLPQGRAARAQLAALRHAHRGDSCAILGNGPSLAAIDPDQLSGATTFSLNRGYLFWRKRDRGPSYFVAVNDLVIEQFHEEIAMMKCPLFVPWIYRDRFAHVPNAIFVQLRTEQRFVTDVRAGVAPCGTVTVAALQLAFHMGFQRVYMLGVDHRFAPGGAPHETVRQRGADPNHFRDDYFGEGVRWHRPALGQSERGYELARYAFEAAGRTVLNATPGSALEVFPRIESERALAELTHRDG